MIFIYQVQNLHSLFVVAGNLSKPTAKRKQAQFRSVYYNAIGIIWLKSNRTVLKLRLLRQILSLFASYRNVRYLIDTTEFELRMEASFG